MLGGTLPGRGVAVLRWLGDSIPEASTYRTSQALAAALGISLRMPPLRRWQKSHAEILRGCKVQCSEGQRWQSATAKSKHLKLHLSLMCFRFATVHGSAWFSRLAAPAQVPDIFPACCTRSANSSRSRSTYAGGSRLQDNPVRSRSQGWEKTPQVFERMRITRSSQ